jgi:hypothetical protein
MRRTLPGLVLLAAVCVWPAAAEAREVVEFADGRYLEIRSYVVRGDLIRLDVATGSFMVIPVASVDEIKRDRDLVFSRGRVILPGARSARVTSAHDTSDRGHREAPPMIQGATIAGS